jgi:hypothetical protein
MVRAAIIAPSVLGRLELAACRHEIVDDHNVHRMDSSEFQSFATTGCGQNSIAEGFDEMPPSFQVCQLGPRPDYNNAFQSPAITLAMCTTSSKRRPAAHPALGEVLGREGESSPFGGTASKTHATFRNRRSGVHLGVNRD